MSTIAQSARTRRAPARARARSAGGRRSWAVGGGVFWIVVFAALLAGVVAVNVTVLRLNLQLDQVGRERTELRADISRLRSEISRASTTSRIDRLAGKELGLVRADSDELIFVRIER
ncbi:MAG: cell division protein FtsL [Gaiellaceae bacterium]